MARGQDPRGAVTLEGDYLTRGKTTQCTARTAWRGDAEREEATTRVV